MSPRQLFVEQLLPALSDFLDEYESRSVGLGKDLRRAADVADILLNFPDYLFGDHPRHAALSAYKDARQYREQQAWTSEPLYELACDFANAWKHRLLSRENRLIEGIGQAQEMYAFCKYVDASGAYFRTRKIVILSLPDGREMDVRRLLVASSKYWASELHRLGHIPSIPTQCFQFTEYIARDDVHQALPLTVHCIKNEPIHLEARSFDFDNTLNQLIVAAPDPGATRDAHLAFHVHESPFEA